MRPMFERWILLLSAACCSWGVAVVTAFAPSLLPQRTTTVVLRRNLALDPNDLLHHATAVATTTHHPALEALFSTLYATTGDMILQPAHEHTNPLFGPPDPYLLSGKSIAPLNPNAFVESVGGVLPKSDIPNQITEGFDKAASAGWNVINPGKILQLNNKVLAGFQDPGHFLPGHVGPEETKESLAVEMSTVAGLMSVVNQLPRAAFAYVLAEFFVIRPGYDVYKDEVEDNPPAAAVEFLALTGTRLGFMGVIGLLCLGLFDK